MQLLLNAKSATLILSSCYELVVVLVVVVIIIRLNCISEKYLFIVLYELQHRASLSKLMVKEFT